MTTAEQSSQVLSYFKDLMDWLEIPFCLFLGTALWAYRDWAFCPWDEDDMDVAVDIKYFNRVDDIKKAIVEQSQLTHVHDFIAQDGIAPEISFSKRHNKQGDYTKIDIFFISGEKDKNLFRFYLNDNAETHLNKYFDKKHWDTWDRVTFFWVEYNVPGDIEGYLESNYWKNWRTPIHRKDWSWSKDNLCPEFLS